MVGIDLGSGRTPSAISLLNEDLSVIEVGYFSDVEEVRDFVSPGDMVAVDAPLTLPPRGKRWRKAEEMLFKMGVAAYSPSLANMRNLHRKAKRLAETLKLSGVEVYEVYPHATFHVLWKRVNHREGLGPKKSLKGLGQRITVLAAHLKDFDVVKVLLLPLPVSLDDALDSLAAALTLHFVRTGRAKALGGVLWVPNP